MKAIETVYKGYKFRSRLEARWAVFFDALRVEFEYEPEGYDLGDGLRYLPDFWLPDSGLFVEIKPKHYGATELSLDKGGRTVSWRPYGGFDPEEARMSIKKMMLLTAQTHKPVLLLEGNPYPGDFLPVVYYGPTQSAGIFDGIGCCVECGTFTWWRDADNWEYGTPQCRRCGKYAVEETTAPMSVFQVARQARFEHRNKEERT